MHGRRLHLQAGKFAHRFSTDEMALNAERLAHFHDGSPHAMQFFADLLRPLALHLRLAGQRFGLINKWALKLITDVTSGEPSSQFNQAGGTSRARGPGRFYHSHPPFCSTRAPVFSARSKSASVFCFPREMS